MNCTLGMLHWGVIEWFDVDFLRTVVTINSYVNLWVDLMLVCYASVLMQKGIKFET